MEAPDRRFDLRAGSVPLHPLARLLPDCAEPPARVFSRLVERPGAVFLDCAAAGGDAVSVLACEPEQVMEGDLRDPGPLRSWLADNAVPNPAGVDYPAGGAIGHVTYEGRYRFGLYRNLLAFCHDHAAWIEVGRARQWLEGPQRHPPGPPPARLEFAAEGTREAYEAAVRRAQEYIAAGDIYQVNLAQRFAAGWPAGAQAWDFYQVLRQVSPAPYAAFLSWEGGALLSASPELFLRFSGRRVETRPIKGTRPRFADPRRDEAAARDLLASPKERAELLMITDLERNDLGRFCAFGSVETRELARLERFAQVHHLVSVVAGTLRPEIAQVDALALAFPGGSITGAPKKRAMEIIRELEGGSRGAYTGAIGCFGLNGVSRFSIAIRTAELRGGRLEFQSGAGIVADSAPPAEYEETLHKAEGFFRAAETWAGMEERIAPGADFRGRSDPDGPRTPVF